MIGPRVRNLFFASTLVLMLVGPLFIPAYAFSTGMAASLVIGQADFVHSVLATSQTGLYFPRGSAFDAGELVGCRFV